MGFVKRNIELEKFLDSIEVEWSPISDSKYKGVSGELIGFIETGDFTLLEGDEAYRQFIRQLPLNGYIFSAPSNKYFSIYESGRGHTTFGYHVNNLRNIDRESINRFECVVANEKLSFCCTFNHEWQAYCPEKYYENDA